MAARHLKHLPHDQAHIDECTRFCSEVESLIREDNSKAEEREAVTGKKSLRLDYVEAVLTVAERHRLDPEFAATYLNPEIKQKMRFEWENKHMLPRAAQLPF